MDFGRDALSRDFAAAKPELEAVRDVMARTSPDRAKAFDTEIQQAFRDLDPTNPTTASARAEARLDRRGNDGAKDDGLAAYPQAGGQDGGDGRADQPVGVQVADAGDIGEALMDTFGDPSEARNAIAPQPGKSDPAKASDTSEAFHMREDASGHLRNDEATGARVFVDPSSGKDMTDSYDRPIHVAPNQSVAVGMADAEAARDAGGLVGDINTLLDGETPADGGTMLALKERIAESFPNHAKTRDLLNRVVDAAAQPESHEHFKAVLERGSEPLRDAGFHAKSRETAAYLEKVAKLDPDGVEGYRRKASEASVAFQDAFDEFVKLAKFTPEEMKQFPDYSPDVQARIDRRLTKPGAELKDRAVEMGSYAPPPHPDHSVELSRSFERDEAWVRDRSSHAVTAGLTAAGGVGLGLAKGAARTALGAAEAGGATYVGARDARNLELKRVVSEAGIDMTDPTAVREYAQTHRDEIAGVGIKAAIGALSEMAGFGVGKAVASKVSEYVGDIPSTVVEEGIEEGVSSYFEDLLN